MKVVNHVTELIGNTPMLKINSFPLPEGVNLYAKLEFFNPGGSVKDRIGEWIIKKAEERGQLKNGYTIIEATAGNTGIGLALAAVNRGYEIIFVVPGKFSKEKQIIMEALGAKIVNTPTEKGLLGAFDKVEELKREIGTVFIADQFNNLDNVEAHYRFTAKEIYKQMDRSLIYKLFVMILLIAPVGFFMGMPFPRGIKKLRERQQLEKIPLMIGVNGFASVFGATLALVVSMEWGYYISELLAVGIYVMLFLMNQFSQQIKE